MTLRTPPTSVIGYLQLATDMEKYNQGGRGINMQRLPCVRQKQASGTYRRTIQPYSNL